RIPRSLDQAAASLGHSPAAALRRVHLPLLGPAMAAAALLVFVDTMKELPATLLLRPLNFETLATWLYAEASRGTYEEGAVAAMMIVLVGLQRVALLESTGLSNGRERISLAHDRCCRLMVSATAKPRRAGKRRWSSMACHWNWLPAR